MKHLDRMLVNGCDCIDFSTYYAQDFYSRFPFEMYIARSYETINSLRKCTLIQSNLKTMINNLIINLISKH